MLDRKEFPHKTYDKLSEPYDKLLLKLPVCMYVTFKEGTCSTAHVVAKWKGHPNSRLVLVD